MLTAIENLQPYLVISEEKALDFVELNIAERKDFTSSFTEILYDEKQ